MNSYIWAIIGTTYCLTLMAGMIIGFVIQKINQNNNKKGGSQ